MHAFLVITSANDISEQMAKKLVPQAKRVIRYKIEKITDTKELIRRTNLALEPTVYLVDGLDEASIEAQNSLLKRLEEPQPNLSFVLTAKKEDKMLPTIVSRCQVIRLKAEKKVSTTQKENTKFVEGSIEKRLAIVSGISKREDATVFLENLISDVREAVPENQKYRRVLKSADIALNRINQNANSTIQLTHFALAF